MADLSQRSCLYSCYLKGRLQYFSGVSATFHMAHIFLSKLRMFSLHYLACQGNLSTLIHSYHPSWRPLLLLPFQQLTCDKKEGKEIEDQGRDSRNVPVPKTLIPASKQHPRLKKLQNLAPGNKTDPRQGWTGL